MSSDSCAEWCTEVLLTLMVGAGRVVTGGWPQPSCLCAAWSPLNITTALLPPSIVLTPASSLPPSAQPWIFLLKHRWSSLRLQHQASESEYSWAWSGEWGLTSAQLLTIEQPNIPNYSTLSLKTVSLQTWLLTRFLAEFLTRFRAKISFSWLRMFTHHQCQ